MTGEPTTREYNPLRDYLKQAGMTQEQLAREIDTSFAFVNMILNGKNTDIRISRLVALHRATGVPYLELIEYLNGSH